LNSETEGSSRAVFTAVTLLLASTMRARTPATSKVRGGGRGKRGEVAGDVIRRLFTVACAHAFCRGIGTRAGRKVSGRIIHIGMYGGSNTVSAGDGGDEGKDSRRFHGYEIDKKE
jgi:hypothetical protein